MADAENASDAGGKVAAIHDRVNLSVCQLRLGTSKVRRKLLAGGLLDDAGT